MCVEVMDTGKHLMTFRTFIFMCLAGTCSSLSRKVYPWFESSAVTTITEIKWTLNTWNITEASALSAVIPGLQKRYIQCKNLTRDISIFWTHSLVEISPQSFSKIHTNSFENLRCFQTLLSTTIKSDIIIKKSQKRLSWGGGKHVFKLENNIINIWHTVYLC